MESASSKEAYKSGDIIVHKMSLHSLDGAKSIDNITSIVGYFNIYESIIYPVLTADFHILDALGIVSSFPIIGEEYIEIELQTPGRDSVTYKFFIVSVQNKSYTKVEDKGSYYTLTGISEEFLNNNKVVHRILKGKDPSQAIKQILTNDLKSKKKFDYSSVSSDKTIDFNLTNINPLAAIDKIRLSHYNKKRLASATCFFETKNGFVYKTIEDMYKDGKGKIGDKIFFYDTIQNEKIEGKIDFRNIIGISQVSEVSMMQKVLAGSLNSQIKTFDVITGEVTTKKYKDKEKSESFEYADDKHKDLNSDSGRSKFGAEISNYLFNAIDSSAQDPNIQNFLLERISYVNKITQQIYRTKFYGDLDLTAGDVITINLPSGSGLTDGQSTETDKKYTGNFLVSKIRHMIQLDAPRATHATVCELLKGNRIEA